MNNTAIYHTCTLLTEPLSKSETFIALLLTQWKVLLFSFVIVPIVLGILFALSFNTKGKVSKKQTQRRIMALVFMVMIFGTASYFILNIVDFAVLWQSLGL